jgi:MFS superfamily sulfate permease-like transporter
VLLLVAVLALPLVLNRIPLAALAAVLLYTGFKLAHPSLWRVAWKLGWTQLIPFRRDGDRHPVHGPAARHRDRAGGRPGLHHREHLRRTPFERVSPPGAVLTRYSLPDHVTFLSKASLARALDAIPPGTRVEIDGRRTKRFDYDALEQLLDFRHTARARGIDYRLVGVPEVETTPSH